MQKIFHLILEVFSWLKIAASPLIIGTIIGIIIYAKYNNQLGFIIAISFVIVGILVGVILATKIWKKEGTHFFLSKILNDSDLDKKAEK